MQPIALSLILGAALATALPHDGTKMSATEVKRDSVDVVSAGDYTHGTWGKRDSVDVVSAGDYTHGTWGKRDSVDVVSAGDYTHGTWGKREDLKLTAADIDDICTKLTSSGAEVAGIPSGALVTLCSFLTS